MDQALPPENMTRSEIILVKKKNNLPTSLSLSSSSLLESPMTYEWINQMWFKSEGCNCNQRMVMFNCSRPQLWPFLAQVRRCWKPTQPKITIRTRLFFIIAIWLNHNLREKHLRYLLIHLGRGRGDWCGFGWFLLIAGLNNLDWADLPLCNLESLLVSTGHLQERRWSWLLRRLLGRSRATVGSLLLRRGVVGGWRWNRWWWKADWIGLVAPSCESDILWIYIKIKRITYQPNIRYLTFRCQK